MFLNRSLISRFQNFALLLNLINGNLISVSQCPTYQNVFALESICHSLNFYIKTYYFFKLQKINKIHAAINTAQVLLTLIKDMSSLSANLYKILLKLF